MFYTPEWKGDRFPDGRPKFQDNLLERALDVSIEDVWDYLRGQGYVSQFEGGWQALHIEKPFAGRALTAQYMPTRADMAKAIAAEGKAEGRVSGVRAQIFILLAFWNQFTAGLSFQVDQKTGSRPFPVPGVYFVELWYNGLWILDQRLEVV